jgi:deoxyribose-phosphate aldolase
MIMELSQILSKCDHTLLGQASTWNDIKAICDDGMLYKTASVCIPASFVKQAKDYVGDRLAICTVIGFPNGYATTKAKCFMASDAVDNGADEVDRVIDIGWAKEGEWAEIKAICDDGMRYKTASVCIPASFVKQAKDYVGDKLAICTVIGFPNGYATTKAKCFMASDAVENGADEIDMVINLGWVKDCKWDALLAEIRAVKEACGGKLLKVIIETCLLTDEEKIELCRIVSQSGAEYIKTSTGSSKAGATFHDVELFAAHVEPHVKIKAAGGISSMEDAEGFLQLGASRLGTSRIVKIAKSQK